MPSKPKRHTTKRNIPCAHRSASVGRRELLISCGTDSKSYVTNYATSPRNCAPEDPRLARWQRARKINAEPGRESLHKYPFVSKLARFTRMRIDQTPLYPAALVISSFVILPRAVLASEPLNERERERVEAPVNKDFPCCDIFLCYFHS